MKLKVYIEALDKLVKENKDALELDLVYSKDDEGNSFDIVKFVPSIGYFDECNFDYTQDELEYPVNSVCIN